MRSKLLSKSDELQFYFHRYSKYQLLVQEWICSYDENNDYRVCQNNIKEPFS
jgi:hypothetical protein